MLIVHSKIVLKYKTFLDKGLIGYIVVVLEKIAKKKKFKLPINFIGESFSTTKNKCFQYPYV